MKRCKACNEPYRKGELAAVNVGGKLVQARVCPKCAARAFKVCITAAAAPCACGEVAKVCGKCVDKREQRAAILGGDLTWRIKHLKGLLKAFEASGRASDIGRADGLQIAINYLESAAALMKAVS